MRWSIRLAVLALAGSVSVASAQDDPPYECDNTFGQCGTPEQSGGGGGGGGGSILVNNTDLGDTYQFADDFDDDGIEDNFDNCARVSNRDQADADGDEVGDGCDNCLSAANLDQFDIDGDKIGDACDTDRDGDEVLDASDNCPSVPNAIASGDSAQSNLDADTTGDACDDDIDGDGMVNLEDPCPMNKDIATPTEQQRALCFPDADGDATADVDDICPSIYNPDQADLDADGLGDECDPDADGDEVANLADNCSAQPNGNQLDADRDGLGDGCDATYCYVVLGDQGNCLDPRAVMMVYSPDALANTGEMLRLRLFANRQNQAMRFTWSVVSAPNGSSATIENSVGTVTISTPYEYHYLKDATPSFVPDQPGTYQLKVVTQTVWEDRVSSTVQESAERTITVTVSGDPVDLGGSGGGCSVAASRSNLASGWTFGLVAVIGALVLRRRRG